MKTTWVLVADSEKARLFEFERREGPWVELACFVNTDSARGGSIQRPPRVQESFGSARHAIEPHTTEKDKVVARFASTLAAALRTAREQHRFQSLVIAASPRFLGALHGQLDKSLAPCVRQEIRHNHTRLGSAAIRDYLQDRP